MSTTPFLAASPGFMLVALRIAVPSLLFSIESEPALNVLLGLAVRAEKSAPEPTAVATAIRPSASVARVRLRLPLPSSDGGDAANVALPTAPAVVPRLVAAPAGATSAAGPTPAAAPAGPPPIARPPSAAPSIPRRRRRNFILLPTAHLPSRHSVRRAR